MSDDRTIDRLPNWGVVTFLDILGWKGIYNRHEEPLSTLKGLIDYIMQAEVQTRGLLPLGSKIVVKSISDTIVILNRCPRDDATGSIRAHGILCCAAIPYSIERGIPVRGATAAGEYEHSENAFVGKAIDEAAAWHEASDWIGVNLTPSAEFAYSDEYQTNWVKYDIPLKRGPRWKPHCVNWPFFSQNRVTKESLCRSFTELGPIIPEITGKFTNTLEFYERQLPATEEAES